MNLTLFSGVRRVLQATWIRCCWPAATSCGTWTSSWPCSPGAAPRPARLRHFGTSARRRVGASARLESTEWTLFTWVKTISIFLASIVWVIWGLVRLEGKMPIARENTTFRKGSTMKLTCGRRVAARFAFLKKLDLFDNPASFSGGRGVTGTSDSGNQGLSPS